MRGANDSGETLRNTYEKLRETQRIIMRNYGALAKKKKKKSVRAARRHVVCAAATAGGRSEGKRVRSSGRLSAVWAKAYVTSMLANMHIS